MTSARRFDGRTLAGFAVSIIAIAGCAWWASKQERPRLPSDAVGYAVLLGSLAVYAFLTIVRGWRWDHILAFLDVRHARADAYALVTVGYMGNTVLPARGGELLRVFLLAERSHAKRREVLGSIITERLLDALVLLLLLVFVAWTGIADTPGGSITSILAAAVLVLVVGGAYGYLRLRQAGRFEHFADRIRPISRASRQLLSARGLVLLAVTIAIWLGEAVVFSLCARSLDLDVTVLDGLVVTVISALSALIPAGPGYVGTYDAAALFALHQVGISGGDAVSCVLLFRFVAFVPITIVGLIVMVTRYGGLRGALRRERDAERADQDGSSPERS
ncbi:MAG: lysylphosphatidylglycerol synthase transmembrane domain-containing protein [Baekduia sp.]